MPLPKKTPREGESEFQTKIRQWTDHVQEKPGRFPGGQKQAIAIAAQQAGVEKAGQQVMEKFMDEEVSKAGGGGHKYVKRERVNGKWKYYYKEPATRQQTLLGSAPKKERVSGVTSLGTKVPYPSEILTAETRVEQAHTDRQASRAQSEAQAATLAYLRTFDPKDNPKSWQDRVKDHKEAAKMHREHADQEPEMQGYYPNRTRSVHEGLADQHDRAARWIEGKNTSGSYEWKPGATPTKLGPTDKLHWHKSLSDYHRESENSGQGKSMNKSTTLRALDLLKSYGDDDATDEETDEEPVEGEEEEDGIEKMMDGMSGAGGGTGSVLSDAAGDLSSASAAMGASAAAKGAFTSAVGAGQAAGSSAAEPGGAAQTAVGLGKQAVDTAGSSMASKPPQQSTSSSSSPSPMGKALRAGAMVIPRHCRQASYDSSAIRRSATTQTSRMYTSLAPPVQDTLQEAAEGTPGTAYKSCSCGIMYKSDKECPRCAVAKTMVPRTDVLR